MRTQNLNRQDAEKFWGVFTNVSGGTISNGHAVQLTNLAASLDGNNVVSPRDLQGVLFVGIADADISDTQPGLVQTYGYKDSVHLFALGTSVTVTANDVIGQGDASSNGGFGSAAHNNAAHVLGPAIALETATVSAGTYVRGFIRAM